jgi:hypothetical protein
MVLLAVTLKLRDYENRAAKTVPPTSPAAGKIETPGRVFLEAG